MKLDWQTHGYSWAYILINFILCILGFVFWLQDPKEVNVSDLQLVDAPYVAVLLELYTTGITYTLDATNTNMIPASTPLAPPAKLTLETLGSYSALTKNPTKAPKKLYGLDYAKLATAQYRFKDTPAIVSQMANVLYTGISKGEVVLASPLWAYEHNVQLLSGICTDIERANSMAANRVGVNTPVVPVAPVVAVPTVPPGPVVAPTVPGVTVVSPRILQCSPAYPTKIDYKKCYETLRFHKSIFAFYTISSFVLLLASIVTYGFLSNMVPYVQRFSLFYHIVIIAILSVGINYGVPGLTNECPDKQTGLASLYQILITVFVGIIVVVIMQVIAELVTAFPPHTSVVASSQLVDDEEENADGTELDPSKFSCNYRL